MPKVPKHSNYNNRYIGSNNNNNNGFAGNNDEEDEDHAFLFRQRVSNGSVGNDIFLAGNANNSPVEMAY